MRHQVTIGDREFWFSTSIVGIRDEQGQIFAFEIISRNITGRKSIEDRMINMEKLASIGTLAAGVAHEINNPLAGILIYAELLARELEQESPIRENVEVIINQTMRCQQIVNRLLDFSRQSLGEKKLLDVNEILRRCVELVRHQAFFHNIKIELELGEELPQIVGDPGQLQQVFTNLLLNAIDAMAPLGGGTLALRLGRADGAARVEVEDEGPGIPPERLQSIFEPFFTTKRDSGGTGLGLSISHSIVEQHGGTIAVENLARGCRFTVVLPLAPARDAAAE